MALQYNLRSGDTPKDEHGQPAIFIRANWENYVSKAFDQLKGICHGILADGVIHDAEAKYFQSWIKTNSEVEQKWPFSDIARRVEAIFEDGIVTQEEQKELKEIMEEITGGSYLPHVGIDDTSSALPLCKPQPESIEFEGSEFCVTGKFAFGTRSKIVEAIAERRGMFNSNPRWDTRYLVIGHFCSRDWAYTSYGRKIERAVELRDRGSGICIVGEEIWKRALL